MYLSFAAASSTLVQTCRWALFSSQGNTVVLTSQSLFVFLDAQHLLQWGLPRKVYLQVSSIMGSKQTKPSKLCLQSRSIGSTCYGYCARIERRRLAAQQRHSLTSCVEFALWYVCAALCVQCRERG